MPCQWRGLTRCCADIITAIHANVPMDSVAAAMRSAVLPKYAVFHTVISSIIPGLGESRIMQVTSTHTHTHTHARARFL